MAGMASGIVDADGGLGALDAPPPPNGRIQGPTLRLGPGGSIGTYDLSPHELSQLQNEEGQRSLFRGMGQIEHAVGSRPDAQSQLLQGMSTITRSLPPRQDPQADLMTGMQQASSALDRRRLLADVQARPNGPTAASQPSPRSRVALHFAEVLGATQPEGMSDDAYATAAHGALMKLAKGMSMAKLLAALQSPKTQAAYQALLQQELQKSARPQPTTAPPGASR